MFRSFRSKKFSADDLERIARSRQSGNSAPPDERLTDVATLSRDNGDLKETRQVIVLPDQPISGIGFFLSGRPVPKERPRLTVSLEKLHVAVLARDFSAAKAAFRVRTPKKTLVYEREIANAVRMAMGSMEAMDGDVRIRLHFSLTKRKGGRPDLDNLIKAIMDGMNKIFWVDDRQVQHLQASIEYTNNRPEGVFVMASAHDNECFVSEQERSYVESRQSARIG